MKKSTLQTMLLPALAMIVCNPAAAISDRQYRAITELGGLNGIALHCGYVQQSKQMKRVLIATLPKRRALGQAFDEATNASFLEFIGSGQVCPELPLFRKRVNESVQYLEMVFSR